MTSIREKYLEKIKIDFEVLSKVVLLQLDLSRQFICNNKNQELHTTIEHNEVIIDSLEVKIRNEVINSIVLYTPKASDSRKIISYHDMTAYLERIGDLILNIANLLQEIDIQGDFFKHFQEILLEQLNTLKKMTQNAIFAFTCEDANLAKEIINMDDIVDHQHQTIIHDIPPYFIDQIIKAQNMSDALALNSISHNLERIGDNATNIAEAAIYLMEGKDVKHIHADEIV